MCGIAGIINLQRDAAIEVAEEMGDCLAHRGPDGSGAIAHGRICFSHRRLSILDLPGGAQPMWDSSQRYLITFNGEIFNYIELREALQNEGVAFRTSGDTEVILEAYKNYGTASFARLNGQFAFALHDTFTNETFLVRDRMGEKPLFFFVLNDSVAFASEIKALRLFCHRVKAPLQYDSVALSDYLSLNYVPGNRTMWAGIHSLPPGHFAKITELPFSIVEQQWDCDQGSTIVDCPDWPSLMEGAIEQSVKLRLRSDVPVGVFFSGGIDSTLISTIAFQQARNLTAFIGAFQSKGFSEAEPAVWLCRQAQIPFEVVQVEPSPKELPDLVQRLAAHCDEPLGDSSSVPVFLLAQRARNFVKVVLTGDGGDELFGGYLTHRATLLSASLPSPIRQIMHHAAFLTRLIPPTGGKVSIREKADRFLRCIHMQPGAAHFAWNGMFSQVEKTRLLSWDVLKDIVEQRQDTFQYLSSKYFANPNSPTLGEVLRADQRTYLSNDILRKVDRMTMAVGLEARPVFLDPEIVGLSRRLPSDLLIDGREQRVLLRRLLTKRAPWYPVRRPKQGFSVPIHSWLAKHLRELFQDLLHSTRVANSGVLNQGEVARVYEMHQRGLVHRGFELWGILILMLQMQHHE